VGSDSAEAPVGYKHRDHGVPRVVIVPTTAESGIRKIRYPYEPDVKIAIGERV